MGIFRRRRRRRPFQLTLPGTDEARGRFPLESRPNGTRAGLRARLLLAPLPRRSFLSRSLGWVTAAIASALGIPAVIAAVSPAFRKTSSQWSPIGRPGAPPGEPDLATEGTPLLTSFASIVQDAYVKPQLQHVPVFVLHRGEDFIIYDVRCTHLGCPVNWDPRTQKFYSPCHGGVFDIEGRVLAGPPPRPLDRYEVKIEDGILYAGRLYRVGEKLARTTT